MGQLYKSSLKQMLQREVLERQGFSQRVVIGRKEANIGIIPYRSKIECIPLWIVYKLSYNSTTTTQQRHESSTTAAQQRYEGSTLQRHYSNTKVAQQHYSDKRVTQQQHYWTPRHHKKNSSATLTRTYSCKKYLCYTAWIISQK